MISPKLAQELKEAGLVWRMNNHDFFSIPDRNLDGRIFVLSDMMAYMDLIKGWPVVSFHGTSEWALDYILSHEVVWMPTESQLREELMRLLEKTGSSKVTLTQNGQGAICDIRVDGENLQFTADSAVDAYGHSLLHLLQQLPENQSSQA